GICETSRAGRRGVDRTAPRASARTRRRLFRDGRYPRHRSRVQRRPAPAAPRPRRRGRARCRLRTWRRRHASRLVRERRRYAGPRPRASPRRPLAAMTLREALETEVDGEVRFDAVSRALYSTDASVYQIEPLAVVIPRSRDALVRIVQICARFK